MFILTTRKRIIKEFAKQIANLQKRADEVYYKDNPPKENENDHASWLLDQVIPLQKMCRELGISNKVYEEAYKIYDFRNSGKIGYTLMNGKIIKE
jgi:hypothetical protein